MGDRLSISFEGAARTVTGSRRRLRFGARAWLFDCGLYQGHRDEAERVNRTFRFDPATLTGVVVSHAHLDHTGNLPSLVARGYRGTIHATPATAHRARRSTRCTRSRRRSPASRRTAITTRGRSTRESRSRTTTPATSWAPRSRRSSSGTAAAPSGSG